MDAGNKKVVVVGASAVGSLAAAYLAQNGLDVTVLEEDNAPGKFGKCGGIFSKGGLDATGVPYRRILLNEVKGARIISPNAVMRVKSKDVKGVVLARQQFDELCADYASSAGARLHFNSRVNSYKTNKKITAITNNSNYSSSVLVAADGIGSLAAKSLGFQPFRQSDIVLSYQAEFDGAKVFDKEMVDVLLDNANYKNFFAWTIPVNEQRIRVGVATTETTKINQAKDAVMKNKFIAEQIAGAKKVFDFYYSIPLHYRKQTQKRIGDCYVLLVGDAAGQVKATTGGGVVFGAKCARIAADETKKFIDGRQTAIDYDARWRREHGYILRLHYLVHRAYRLLPNSLVDVAVKMGGVLGLEALLSARGDMDYFLR